MEDRLSKHPRSNVSEKPKKGKQFESSQEVEEGGLSGAVACFAKLLVFTFSFVVLVLGFLTIIMGFASLGELADTISINTFFTDLIPGYMGYTLLSMGGVMLVVAFIGCFSCCCRGSARGSVLRFLYFFTFGIFFVSGCSFLFGIEYKRIITFASTNAFIDSPEGNGPIYRGIKNGFKRAYDTCQPVAYRTDELFQACATKLSSDDTGTLSFADRAALETCQSVDPDKVYLYCRSDGDDWKIDEAYRIKHPSWKTIEANPDVYNANARQFDWWMSRICMPNTTAFERAAAYAANTSDLGSGFPTTADLSTSEQTTTRLFNNCWDSTWFDQDTLEEGIPMYADPDWLATGGADPLKVSAKLIFCFCASEPAAQEELWEVVLRYAGYGQWLALGMACFFFLTYLAETYLLCFKREAMEEFLDNASNWEATTSSIGGISHQMTSFAMGRRGGVELREGGAAAVRNQTPGEIKDGFFARQGTTSLIQSPGQSNNQQSQLSASSGCFNREDASQLSFTDTPDGNEQPPFELGADDAPRESGVHGGFHF